MQTAISNTINEQVNLNDYQFNPTDAIFLAAALDTSCPTIKTENKTYRSKHRHRNDQTRQLLDKLHQSIIPCQHQEWLYKRNIQDASQFKSIELTELTKQDQLDLYILPSDHILDNYHYGPIIGPTVCDIREGKLCGITIRNITKDLDYAGAEKFTTSNYGWFLDGYDLYQPPDEIYIVEGIFDAYWMRKRGYNSIALSSCYPSAFQIACLIKKFYNINLCLDNDFWGHIGALTVARVLEWPIYLCNHKDPGESDQLQLISRDYLEDITKDEIQQYEATIKHTRPLPYNQ